MSKDGPELQAAIAGAQRIEALLGRHLQVVAGKGGVGRTVVSCALALRSARDGYRTLLLEVNAPDSAARMLGVPPCPDEPREILEDLWLCRMTPSGSQREYALMVLKFKALYNVVFENRLVKYLLRSIPSLAEFTMLGKVWFHATERLKDGRPKYDRVVIDAPATGHAITFLSLGRVVAETVPEGIMRTASERMAALIESRDETCLHLVAVPEEMPVNEALELAEAARNRLKMDLGLAVVNKFLRPLLEPGEGAVLEAIQARGDPALAPYVNAARRRLDWEEWQADCAKRFAEGSRMPLVKIPQLDGDRIDLAWLAQVVECFDLAAGRVHPSTETAHAVPPRGRPSDERGVSARASDG